MADINPLCKLEQQAINAALCGRWPEASRLNQELLKENPGNTETLNRLARASFELGDLNKAKKYYGQALQVDPYNQIAAKFIKKIETCKKRKLQTGSKKNDEQTDNFSLGGSVSDLFIEEPGRTRLVNLLKVAEPQRLSYLCPGETVKLVPKNRYISVTDTQGDYLGILPDDLSHRLIRFIKGGNKYQALTKAIKANGLTILIRETFRSGRFKNQPSFTDSSDETLILSSDHLIVPGVELPLEEPFEMEEENTE